MDSKEIRASLSSAISHYWSTREKQGSKQKQSGKADQGARSAVTGGAQMDGFITLLTKIIIEAGISTDSIYQKRSLELPGFFRPTKEWDLLVIQNEQLIVALELKSQVGPSFGNNFNNRTEEAMGSALDLWTAYREGAFNKTIKPWLGYMFLLEDCPNQIVLLEHGNRIFQYFPNLKMRLMRKDMKFFVESYYAKGIILLPHF